MRKHICLAVVVTIAAGLLSPGIVASVRAQAAQPQAGGTAGFDAPAAAVGRIAKFVTATTVGNSLLFERNGRIGLGTASPFGTFDITGKSPSLNITGSEPLLMLRDTNAASARSFIRSTNGGLSLLGEDQINKSNPLAFVRIERSGKVGLGTSDPQRLLQIGPDTNALFTIEASDASPNAGYFRFGDGTGWQLNFGRSRQGSGGPLTTGAAGVIMSIKDNSPAGFGGTVIVHGGIQVDLFGSGASPTPVCKNSLNLLSECSSSRRYKTDIRAFTGGLQLINSLQPVSFTWKEDRHPDIGLIAEDVAKVEPRLTFSNQDGAVEGVNYSQLTAALVDAVKEQQEQLERQQRLIEELQSAVARLTKSPT